MICSKAHLKLEEVEDSLKICESVFNQVSKSQYWSSSLGSYIVEALKVVYEVEMGSRSYDHRRLIYYTFTMMHASYAIVHPSKDVFFLERLKNKCEDYKGLRLYLTSSFDMIVSLPEVFSVSNVLNTTFDRFSKQFNKPQVLQALENFKLLYMCMGPDFLMHTLKPIGS